MTNGNSAERERFEEWAFDRGYRNFTYSEEFHGYTEESVQRIWFGWKGALSVCADGGKGEAVATLHDDGYWTWKKGATPPHESNYAGWRMDVYAAPQAECAPREAQPDGWKLVPVEPTQEMVIRANEVEFCEEGITVGQLRAAILAAPAPERAQESAGVLTDNQIREIWMRETGTTEQDSPLAILDFARAVLADNKEPKP